MKKKKLIGVLFKQMNNFQTHLNKNNLLDLMELDGMLNNPFKLLLFVIEKVCYVLRNTL